MKNRILLLLLPLIIGSQSCWAAHLEKFGIGDLWVETIPSRPYGAISGSEFARQTAGMLETERQQSALAELRYGNIPEFLRNLKPVQLSCTFANGKTVTAIIWVIPDYLAIGSDDDFLRIPLTYPTATEFAGEFGFVLPTRKMVDAIYEQSMFHLKPQPMTPGPKMRSNAYYLKHQQKIEAQRADYPLGEMLSGHKKDVVLTNLLHKRPNRIAIYGWHQLNGEPIQPLSTVHGAQYADYSHGIRLVSQTVWIDGELCSILDVLQDPVLAPLLTYEGVISNPHDLMKCQEK